MLQDLKVSLRRLVKSPGFSLIVILTLALGIGANVALFSVVNGVLLNPLPFRDPDQLVMMAQSKPNFEFGAMSYMNFLDLQKDQQTFSSMALARPMRYAVLNAGEPESIEGRVVTADFFKVLDVKAALGRTFMEHEDQPGTTPVAVISWNLWQNKFGAASDILGKNLTLDDKTYQIIGVLPSTYTLYRTNEIYTPMGHWTVPSLRNRRAGLGLHAIGRLKPGVSLEQGKADLNRIMVGLAEAYPDINKSQSIAVQSLKTRIVGDIGTVLWVLLGAVGFVLLIACVNVSNLMLARSTARTREFAIRAALGAGRWRLFRQTLIESMLLASIGGLLGLLVAAWGTQAGLSIFPATLPRAAEVGLDGRVILFAVAASVLAGILSGVFPALRASGWQLAETLKEGGRGATTGRGRAQRALVAIEMALAVVLLIGAGLMIRSLAALWNVNPGFNPNNLLTFQFSLSPEFKKVDVPEVRAATKELSEQIAAIPGVQSVSFSSGAAPLLEENDVYFWIVGQTKPASQADMSMALIYRFEPDYLQTMGIPLKKGRFFTAQDDDRAPRVAVIDEVFARKHFGEADPIGQVVNQDNREPQTIVGVVGHVNQWSIDSDDTKTLQAQLYEPFRQVNNRWNDLIVLVRYDEGTPVPLDAIRRVVYNHNKQHVISKARTMNETIATTLADRRFSMILLDAFAVVALLLASLGLYGVISYLVGQRTQELGIRLALGAQRRDILRLVLTYGMKLALIGVVLGLVAAFGLTRLLTKVLFGVSATDPMTFTVIAVLLSVVALAACIIPARRATKVDPLVALRYE